MTTDFTIMNVEQVEDVSESWGMASAGEARYAQTQLGTERVGMTRYALRANQRMGFGHRHETAEELYFVLSGGGRVKLDDQIRTLKTEDIAAVAPGIVREFEAAEEGMILLAFGEVDSVEAKTDDSFWR